MEKADYQYPLTYLAGNIMGFGDGLARQYEYDMFKQAEIPGEVYSPILNKSINDKSNMTEEENNVLAEKICEADIERLWNSDCVVIAPEQGAIGTMCEMGTLYGWKYMTNQMLEICREYAKENAVEFGNNVTAWPEPLVRGLLMRLLMVLGQMNNKDVYAHYSDIRTNHLNEKDWRRSFSINQMLYGMILYATRDNKLHDKFDEIIPILKEKYKENNDV